jgi:hypothetical protein
MKKALESAGTTEGTNMERIITLLREKNHYLAKFHEINEKELLRFDSGNFDNVEPFYMTRDKILDLIRVIDDLIQEENAKHENNPSCTPEQRDEMEYLLHEKDDYVKKILDQDLEVISTVEKEKSNIIRELQAVNKGRKAIGGYHSGTPNRKVLDEEA